MDEINISRFNKGDRTTFNQVFYKYHQQLTWFAYTLTHNKEDAEDIVIRCFTKLYERCANFETESNIKAFLYISVKNTCHNYRKHQEINSKHLQLYGAGNSDTITDDIEANMQKAEQLKQLYELIADLPPKSQQVIRLVLKGLSHAEIAAELHISANNVAGLVRYATQLLRNLLPVTLLYLLQ